MNIKRGGRPKRWISIGSAFSYVLAFTEREMVLTDGRGHAELTTNSCPNQWLPSWEELVSILIRDPNARNERLSGRGREDPPLSILDIAASKAHRRLLQSLQTGDVRSRAINLYGDIDDREPLSGPLEIINQGEWRGKVISSTDLDGIARLGPIPDYKRSALLHGAAPHKQSEHWWADLEVRISDLTNCFPQESKFTNQFCRNKVDPSVNNSNNTSISLIFESGGWRVVYGKDVHYFRNNKRGPYILAILLSNPNMGFTDDALIYYAKLLKRREIKLREVFSDIPDKTDFPLKDTRSAANHEIRETIDDLQSSFPLIASLLLNRGQSTGCLERIEKRTRYTPSSSHSWYVDFN